VLRSGPRSPPWSQDSGCLAQDRRVGGHVGVHHYRDDSGQGVVWNRQVPGVGLHYGEATTGVAQHSGGQVGAERSPAQFADLRSVDAGAAPDFQAGAVAVGAIAAPVSLPSVRERASVLMVLGGTGLSEKLAADTSTVASGAAAACQSALGRFTAGVPGLLLRTPTTGKSVAVAGTPIWREVGTAGAGTWQRVSNRLSFRTALA